MILCTAADASFRAGWKVLRAYARQYGWTLATYDLGGLGEGTRIHAQIEGWHYKPSLILDALDRYDDDVLYLDCDAYPIMPINHVVERYEYDVAVTVRASHELDGKSDEGRAFMGWTNAGVIFARPSGRPVLKQWEQATRKSETDQHALNHVIHGDRAQPPKAMSSVDVKGRRVLMLPGPIYNHTGDPMQRSPFCRVLHMNGGRWQSHVKSVRVMAGLDEPKGVGDA